MNSEILALVVDQIMGLLNESGLSRYRIAKLSGVPESTLADLAKGKTDPAKMALGNAMALVQLATDMENAEVLKSRLNNMQ